MNYRGHLPKTYVSSLGDVTVGRRYYASRDCDCKTVPWDDWSGITPGHKLTLQARRMVTLAGSRCSFDEAAEKLAELCHFQVSDVSWVVDIYHVCQKVEGCAKEMFGIGSAAAKQWAATKVEELIRVEGPRFIESLEAERATTATQNARDALDGLIGYLRHNRDSLWYRTRLAEGLPIGSGLVEGTCKNMIGKRLKLNNPRWLVERAEKMAALRCLHYSKLWGDYWESKGLAKVG